MRKVTLAQALRDYLGILTKADWDALDEMEREDWRKLLSKDCEIEIIRPYVEDK